MEKDVTESSLPSHISRRECAEALGHCWEGDVGSAGPPGLCNIPGTGRRHQRGTAPCWAPARLPGCLQGAQWADKQEVLMRPICACKQPKTSLLGDGGKKKWEQVSPVCLGLKIKRCSEGRWKEPCEMLPSSPVDLLSILGPFLQPLCASV